MKEIVEIDGARFDDLEGFYDEVSREVLAPGVSWGRNLDAWNDVLRGGFGTPEGGFVLRWKNSARSREKLGHAETVKWLERGLTRCDASNRAYFEALLSEARSGVGETLFERLVTIVRVHAAGGEESGDAVELELV